MNFRRLIVLTLASASLAAGCGGEQEAEDPVAQVPQENGLREKIAEAREVDPADFEPSDGKTMQDLVDAYQATPDSASLATSVFTKGVNRLAFGTVDQQAQFVYGDSAVYVAKDYDEPASGPFVAPADVLVTDPAFRSEQAAAESDPFAAVYAAKVDIPSSGPHVVMTVTKLPGGDQVVASTGTIEVSTAKGDPIPDVGEKAPKVETDTLASAGGVVERIDTRQPPSDLHEASFDEVVGRKPVVLLFATPQLCQSRVCGPVVDVALQLRERYGDQVEFIHQEVYAENDPAQGLRTPLTKFNLRTEPWLFAVDKNGEITSRLEGSFGLNAVDEAIKSAL
ncbi:MAG: hypothetical protein AVDCRST_MAG69-3 [uncultured Solirubrobacteraceae bacterium]|uniref:Thioredoxin domain-containing protein n=1 Tax=uncultured Solirubrobacteraceae bacterium TaxID=1162706 RepID=A0A6J4RM19_9ACTN|nr:MAG: hypothetical protein AVDCRST_MAG69-3 [uncultured Solirubrobacteraceae bacterium]